MSHLLRRPTQTNGCLHDISPKDAGWDYVGFALHRLAPGDRVAQDTAAREVILVLVEGRAEVMAGAVDLGEMGDRMDVFDKRPPHCAYVPNDSHFAVTATTECTLAVCSAPGAGGHSARRIGPEGIVMADRGQGTNLRHIFNIAMEDRDVADSLLVTEVFTPAGHWSSYPPHRHDEDDFPRMTYLEETYYHRLNPAQGFGVQRVFTDDSSLDETITVQNDDVVLVPRGHHPCGAPYGYEMYYLNVMAGPLRKWRFETHPDHAWIAEAAPT